MKPQPLDSEQRLIAMRAIFDATERDAKLEAETAITLIRKLRILNEPGEPIEALTLLEGNALIDALATASNRATAPRGDVATIGYKIGLAVGHGLNGGLA